MGIDRNERDEWPGAPPQQQLGSGRAGGIFALLTLAAVAFAAAVLTIAVAATVLIVALVIAATVLLARTVLPTSWRHHAVAAPTRWPHETIEATVVKPTGPSDERDLLRMDSDKG